MPAASSSPSPADAWRRLHAVAAPLPDVEAAPADAAGAHLAVDVLAPVDLPAFDRSAMDGVAVAAADVRPGTPLPRAAAVPAGAAADAPLPPGHAAPIATGAPLPAGADAVVPREALRETADGVVLDLAPRRGDHVRRAGEDAGRGATLAVAGDRLTAARVGLLSAAGVAVVHVVRRPLVAVVVTGDEVRPDPTIADATGRAAAPSPADPLPAHRLGDRPPPGPSDVHDANGPALRALAAADAAAVVVTHAADAPDAVRGALAAALAAADVVVSTGGASVGEHDHVRGAAASLGLEELLWGVAVRPGAPTGACRGVDGRLLLALPGNPTAAHVLFLLLGRPLLRARAGHPDPTAVHVPARLTAPTRAATGRVAYVPAALAWDDDGRLTATPAPVHGPARAVPLAAADALVRLPPSPDRPPGDVPGGTVVGALLLDGRWPAG